MRKRRPAYWRDKSRRCDREEAFLRDIRMRTEPPIRYLTRNGLFDVIGVYADWLSDQNRSLGAEAWQRLRSGEYRPMERGKEWVWCARHGIGRSQYEMAFCVFNGLQGRLPRWDFTVYRSLFNAQMDFVQAWVTAGEANADHR